MIVQEHVHGPVVGPDGDGSFPVVVRDVRHAADGVVVLQLARTSGEPFPEWTPGAHIDVVISADLERQYSLCGDPADRDTWTIAVLREPESRGGSELLHDRVSAGEGLTVRGPRNEFPLEAVAAHRVHHTRFLFIAGGIGITPLLPMVRSLEAAGADWRMVYGGRKATSMAFVDDLTALGDRVIIWPEDEKGLIDLDGLLGEPSADTKVYCCGPGVLIDAVEQRCAGWPAGALHVERFRPKDGALDGEQTEFEVRLEYSEITLKVGAGQTIADAVEAAGVDIMTSCREGTCGTCETTVLEGIPDHRDSLLTEDEKAANDTMMICCSRSRTPRLVLDL